MEDVLGVYTRPYDPQRPQVCLDETSRQLLAPVTPPRPVAPGRPAIDWAHCIKELVDVCYPDAEQIVLVHGNPEHPHARVAGRGVRAGRGQAAGRPAGRPAGAALHPKHGSWLNMAEIELAVLAGQCLDRRLADQATLQREVAAWQAARNRAGRGVNWRFTTEDARIKLKHLYPAIQD